MDILNPQLVWIKDRCYRKLQIKNSLRNPEEDFYYPSDAPKISKSYEEDFYDDVDIKCEGNNFWTSIFVPPDLIGRVIGKEFAGIKRIEEQTKTKIAVPSKFQKTGPITIAGKARNAVGEAYRRIEGISDSSRWRQPFTHFISFPMNHEVVQSSFKKFQDDVLHRFKSLRGIHKSIFQNPCKLHMTVSTLVLLDATERQKASSVLQNCKTDILDVVRNKPLVVKVKGVEYMNDDPAETDVLYAKVSYLDEEDDSIQIIANKLATAFVDAKLSKQQHDNVKLHITIMNSLFREAESTTGQALQDRETFDARPILEHYKDYEFGEVEIAEIHISVRNEPRKDGYYRSTSVLNLSS